jgi:hypothetical protein
MGSDAAGARASAPAPAGEERVLPLRSARPTPVAANEPARRPITVADPALERRIAALEARAEEQEAMLRRVLILLVDWVENGSQENAYRTHAA